MHTDFNYGKQSPYDYQGSQQQTFKIETTSLQAEQNSSIEKTKRILNNSIHQTQLVKEVVFINETPGLTKSKKNLNESSKNITFVNYLPSMTLKLENRELGSDSKEQKYKKFPYRDRHENISNNNNKKKITKRNHQTQDKFKIEENLNFVRLANVQNQNNDSESFFAQQEFNNNPLCNQSVNNLLNLTININSSTYGTASSYIPNLNINVSSSCNPMENEKGLSVNHSVKVLKGVPRNESAVISSKPPIFNSINIPSFSQFVYENIELYHPNLMKTEKMKNDFEKNENS